MGMPLFNKVDTILVKVPSIEEGFHGVSEEEYQEIVNKQYTSLSKKPNKNTASDTDILKTIKNTT